MIEVVDEAEVVVVGAGPAGSNCAATLAEVGHDVLLLDQSAFPRPKACGDGLGPATVVALERLGLDEMLAAAHDITSARVLGRDVRPRAKRLDRTVKCVGRDVLDAAVLDAARQRGARFLQGRVDRPFTEAGAVEGVILRDGGVEVAIRARCVVAADGATSRLRRTTGLGRSDEDPRARAVRQYFRTARRLDPAFDFFSLDGIAPEGVVGYGWVFPMGDHLANVGIGYYYDNGAAPSLRDALGAFTDELAAAYGHMYGELEPVDKPMGAYLGVGDSVARYQHQRILFVGDACSMTDPISGEGIAHAMRGGTLIAEIASAALTGGRGAEWHEDADVARRMRNGFLKLNRNTSLIRRLGAHHMYSGEDRDVERGERHEPYLEATARVVVAPDEQPTFATTMVGELLAEHDGDVARGLEAVNEATLDALQTTFPFTTETLHHRLRDDGGPMVAATLLLAARAGGQLPTPAVVSVAVGVELLSLFPLLATQSVDSTGKRRATINNALAILAADFAVSRALHQGMVAGTRFAEAFATTGTLMCEGELLTRLGGGGLGDGPLERYVAAADLARGSLYAMAAVTGAQLAGAGGAALPAFAAYGHAMGIVAKTADDACMLGPGDRRIVRAARLCRAQATVARSALREVDGSGGALRALGELPTARLREAFGGSLGQGPLRRGIRSARAALARRASDRVG